MAKRLDPNFGLTYDWTLGAAYKTEMDANLRKLGGLVMAEVLDTTVTDPSSLTPSEGDRYIVAASAIGDWSEQDDDIAVYIDAAWEFHTPENGWVVKVAQDGGYLMEFYDGAWRVDQGVRSSVVSHNFTTDANETATYDQADALVVQISDSGTVLTTGRQLTLPDVRLAVVTVVFNGTAQTITVKGHSDSGSGAVVKSGEMAFCFNLGPAFAVSMFLATLTTKLMLNGASQATASEKLQIRQDMECQPAVNLQTGTTYTLELSDKNGVVEMSNASANTLTVPPNSSVAFDVGDQVVVAQAAAGQTTIAQGSGVTIKNAGGLKIAAQEGMATLIKTGTDTWRIEGRLTT